MPSPLWGCLPAFAAEGDTLYWYCYFLISLYIFYWVGESCWFVCSKIDWQCGSRSFKPFLLKTLPDPPCCGGNQFVDRYLGLKGSRCYCKLTSDQRHLFSMGRTHSQEKSWSETTAQSAFEFLLSARAAAFGVQGDAGDIPARAQMGMQSRCPALLLLLCLHLAPAAPKAPGKSGASLALATKLPGWEFCLIWSNPPRAWQSGLQWGRWWGATWHTPIHSWQCNSPWYARLWPQLGVGAAAVQFKD